MLIPAVHILYAWMYAVLVYFETKSSWLKKNHMCCAYVLPVPRIRIEYFRQKKEA